MKIALFTDSDVFAGTERHILDLALGLLGAGASPRIYCPGQGVLAQRALAAQIPVVAVEKGRGLNSRALRTLVAALRSGDVDLIHSHNGRTAFLAAVARTMARRGALVATQHFIDPARVHRRGLRGWASRGVHRWMLARTDRLVAISQAVADGMLQRREAAPEKIRIVPNGICDPLARVLAEREDVQTRWGAPAGTPLIVCVARLQEEKRVGDLVRAMDLVRTRHPEAWCIIAGEGSDRDSLQRQITQLGLHHSVQLAGFLADPLPLIKAADVFVLPSTAEPFGLVLVEAMALGVPVVATRAGGPMEIVSDHETGLLVPPQEPDALAQALMQILQLPEWARTLGAAGRERFLQRFTAAHMADRMLGVYLESTRRKGSQAVLSDKTGRSMAPVC